MVETPTQKNFKRQMEEIERENAAMNSSDKYGIHRRTVKFDSPIRSPNNSYSWLVPLVITVLLFAGPTILSRSNTSVSQLSVSPNTSLAPIPITSEDLIKTNVCKYLDEASLLKVQANMIIKNLETAKREIVSTDPKYRALSEQISSGIQQLQAVKSQLDILRVPAEAQIIHNTFNSWIVNTIKAEKLLLTALNDGRITAEELKTIRVYADLANEYDDQNMQAIIDALHALKIEFTIEPPDGRIKYSTTIR